MSYYDAIVMVVVFCSLIMLFQTTRTPVLDRKTRRSFRGAFAMLVVIVLTEWGNIQLNGTPDALRNLHYFVKGVEFIATPMLTLCLYDTIPEQTIPRYPFFVMTGINAVLVFLSGTFGFLFYCDENNVYHRGNHHYLFVIIYVSAMLYMATGITLSLKEYQANSLIIVALSGIFAFTGIGIQLFNNDIHTSWLTITMVVIIYYNELVEMTLKTDIMTSVLNRRTYEHDAEAINYRTVVVMFDIDDFKSINDTYGHDAGDECLRHAARYIKKVYGRDAAIYRIGGDEFVAIFKKRFVPGSKRVTEAVILEMSKRLDALIGSDEQNTYHLSGISSGSALKRADEPFADAVKRADAAMYEAKNAKKANKPIGEPTT